MTSTSAVVRPPEPFRGATCLAEGLFETAGVVARVVPSAGSQVQCEHCRRTAFSIKGDVIIVLHRHDSHWHRTVVSLQELGLKRVD